MLCVNILYLLWIHQSLQKYKHFFSFLQTIKLLCTSYTSAQWWVLQNGYEHYFITITYTWNWLGKALLFLYILDKINFFVSNWTRKTSIFHFRIIVLVHTRTKVRYAENTLPSHEDIIRKSNDAIKRSSLQIVRNCYFFNNGFYIFMCLCFHVRDHRMNLYHSVNWMLTERPLSRLSVSFQSHFSWLNDSGSSCVRL